MEGWGALQERGARVCGHRLWLWLGTSVSLLLLNGDQFPSTLSWSDFFLFQTNV